MKVRAVLGRRESGIVDYSTADDVSFKTLAVLFKTDPVVFWGGGKWKVEASVLDQAEDGHSSMPLRREVGPLVARLNGIASLVTHGDGYKPVEPTWEFEGVSYGARGILTSVRAYAQDFVGLDPVAAKSVVDLALTNTDADRVIRLLSRIEPEWVWIDLWRIWDILRSYHPDPPGGPNGAFKAWVTTTTGSPTAFEDFGRSANDPGTSGPAARHGTYTTTRGGSQMTPDAAVELIKNLVVVWFLEEFATLIARQ